MIAQKAMLRAATAAPTVATVERAPVTSLTEAWVDLVLLASLRRTPCTVVAAPVFTAVSLVAVLEVSVTLMVVSTVFLSVDTFMPDMTTPVAATFVIALVAAKA